MGGRGTLHSRRPVRQGGLGDHGVRTHPIHPVGGPGVRDDVSSRAGRRPRPRPTGRPLPSPNLDGPGRTRPGEPGRAHGDPGHATGRPVRTGVRGRPGGGSRQRRAACHHQGDLAEDDTRYLRSQDLRGITTNTVMVLGLAGGGLLVTQIGTSWALALDAMTFVATALIVHRWVRLRAGAGNPADKWFGALRNVFSDRELRVLLALSWLVGLAVVPEGLAAPLADEFGASDHAVGWLLAAEPRGGAPPARALRCGRRLHHHRHGDLPQQGAQRDTGGRIRCLSHRLVGRTGSRNRTRRRSGRVARFGRPSPSRWRVRSGYCSPS